MEKVIYVVFLYESHYPRHQIFKEIGKETYYGRDHFLLWHTINRENGKMIFEMLVSEQITFVICNKKKKELFTSSNKKNEVKFPLLRYRSLAEWDAIKKYYNIVHENGFAIHLKGKQTSVLTKWLLSLKIEYEIKNPDYSGDNEESWLLKIDSFTDEPEILHEFDYCGVLGNIYRILNQHQICRKKWYEYYCGQELIGYEVLS